MAPLQAEINQLNRQFWVTKAQVKANKYDLSASRYRQIEQDEPYYESPQVTMERLLKLEQVMAAEVTEEKLDATNKTKGTSEKKSRTEKHETAAPEQLSLPGF